MRILEVVLLAGATLACTRAPSEAQNSPADLSNLIAAGSGGAQLLDAGRVSEFPADSKLALGPFYVVQMTDSNVDIYNRDLSPVVQPDGGPASIPLWTFVDPTSSLKLKIGEVTDPRIVFDAKSGRYFYSAVNNSFRANKTLNNFFYGWSQANPADLTGGWCHSYYKPYSNYFVDFDSLGTDAYSLHATMDVYGSLNSFGSAILVRIDRPPDDVSCPPLATPLTTTFSPMDGGTWQTQPWTVEDGGRSVYSATVANVISDPNVRGSIGYDGGGIGSLLPGYVRTYIGTITPYANPLYLIVLETDSMMRETFYVNKISAPTWSLATKNADEPDGGSILYFGAKLGSSVAALDPSAAPLNHPVMGIWFSHTIGTPSTNYPETRWYEVGYDEATFYENFTVTAPVLQMGDIYSDLGDSYFNAAISPARDGTSVMIQYVRSSATQFPAIEARIRTASTALGNWQPARLVYQSTNSMLGCSGSSGTCRWGDIVNTVYDPAQPSLLWGTNEMPTVSQGDGGQPFWTTENFSVSTVQRLFYVSGDNQSVTAGNGLANPLTVMVQDDQGNVLQGITVNWATSTSGASIVPFSVTDSNGLASGLAAVSTTAGLNSFSATISNASPLVFSATGVAGGATGLLIQPLATSPFAGGNIRPPAQVLFTDQYGNQANSSASVAISLAPNGSGATLVGTTSVAAVSGVALFPAIAVDTPGSGYSLTATSGSFTTTSALFSVQPRNHAAPVNMIVQSGGNQQGTVATQLAAPLLVLVTDANSVPVADAAVQWTTAAAGASVSSATTTTDGNGLVQVSATLGTVAGTNLFLASIANGPSIAVLETAIPGSPVSLAFSGIPATVTTGVPMSPVPQIFALDQFGNRTWQTTCSILVTIDPSSPFGATFNNWTVMAPQAGTYVFRASCSGLPTTTSPSFSVILGTDLKGSYLTAASLISPRSSHTATLLQDGRVLLAGGYDTNGVALKSAEIFNPGTNSFQSTGSLSYERANHTATLMQDGMVLFVGGTLSDDPYGNYELYNPSTGLFQSAGIDPNGILGRTGHTATLLWDGTVLITGGGDRRTFQGATNAVARYRPGGGFFTDTMNSNRYGHTAVLLPNDVVLIFGGESPDNGTAETYDRHGNVGYLYYFNYTFHPAWAHGNIGESTLLPSGNVLGWRDNILYEKSTGLFDTLSFNPPVPYVQSRNVLLPVGKMLVIGDSGTGSFLLDPMNGNATSQTFNPGFLTSVLPTATLLQDGSVFYVGGILTTGVVNPSSSRFIPGTPPILNSHIDFGVTAIGSSAPAVVTFHNTSSGSITLTSIAAPSGWFTASGLPTLPLTLTAGQTVSVNVAFAPQYQEQEFDQVAVFYAGGSATAMLTGTGATPANLWCSGPTDHGSVGTGGQAKSSVTVRNLGGAPLTITGTVAPVSPFGATNLPVTNLVLSGGQSTTVTTYFNPTVTGQANGSFTVNSTAGPCVASLTGTGIAPTFSVTPTSVAFGSVATNASSTQTVTLKNSATAKLTVASITLPNTPFSTSGLPVAGGFVYNGNNPGLVTFAPSAQTSSADALTIVTSGGSATIPLTGTGVPPAQLVATPTSVAFGSVATGVKASVTVALSNPGGVSLRFTGNTAPAAPFSATGLPATNSTLAAGASINVTASFTPTAQTSSSGSFVVNSTGGNVTVPLTGIGVAPAHLAATPTSLAFGSVAKNTFRTLSLVFSNTGGVPLTITSVTSPSALFSATGLPAVNAQLSAGQQVTSTIKFAPTATGSFTGKVILGSSAGSLTVNFTGNGT